MAATSRGLDVSSFQGAQDWKSIAAGGVTFVQVKASEGEHTHDAHYRMHMDGILAVASLLPQAYHYAWPNQDAATEADNYIGVVKADAEAHPGFVHWLDLERRTDGANYAGKSAAQIKGYATAWVSRVKAAFPRQKVGVYTSGSDLSAGHYPANSDALWYPAYPSGAMSYTQAEQRTRPAPSGVKAFAWQFTSTPLDRSIAYMTPAALRTWAEGDDVALTAAQAAALALIPKLYDNLINIDSLDVTADGKSEGTHGAGFFLAHTRHNALAGWNGIVKINDTVQALTAQVGALSAAMAALKADGGITAEQVTAAAQAGAAAALAELGHDLAEQAPEPAAG